MNGSVIGRVDSLRKGKEIKTDFHESPHLLADGGDFDSLGGLPTGKGEVDDENLLEKVEVSFDFAPSLVVEDCHNHYFAPFLGGEGVAGEYFGKSAAVELTIS